MRTLLFLSLTMFIVVYSFSNKQRGKLGREIAKYRFFLSSKNPKAKENANFHQSFNPKQYFFCGRGCFQLGPVFCRQTC